jgi:hypothetical protein
MEWISVEDGLPDRDQVVLVYKPELRFSRGFITDAQYQPTKFFTWSPYQEEYLDLVCGATHWMPLPEPPK